MLVAHLGFFLILQATFIAGRGNQVYDLPGGGQVVFVSPFGDSNSKPQHKHKERYPDGIKVIQLGGSNGPNNNRDSNLPDGIWDYLKLQNITKDQFPSGFQVIQLGGDNGPHRRRNHDDNDDDDDDDDNALRKIFKMFRFGLRRGGHRSNSQFLNLQGRDLGNHRSLEQDRRDYSHLVATTKPDVPRTRVKIIRQNVPRRMMVRNLRSSQAHLTNMQTLSFPVFEDEWQMT
ncbi:uncharacterized protein LOC110182989 [Drosophila serrata]|uniref:uncharacterized protein LOC110182989 n=1 Tax=Drosophila serrata TaxID=7274 RepID=UPI000A1D394F|nr:uncharacterized protein LOC110182989 [Drosophila serrata]